MDRRVGGSDQTALTIPILVDQTARTIPILVDLGDQMEESLVVGEMAHGLVPRIRMPP